MATEVLMPQMGADMQEGTLLRWIKHPGDHVARGEVIAEIETDKANVEIESFEEGVLEQTLAEEGQVVPVGEAIAMIGQAAPAGGGRAAVGAAAATPAAVSAAPAAVAREAGGNGAAVASPAGVAVAEAVPAEPNGVEAEPTREQMRTPPVGGDHTGPGQRLRVSPVARNIAEELDIDLSTVTGSGPDGRIMRKDVEAAAARAQAAPSPEPVPVASPSRVQAPPAPSPAAAQPAPPVEVPRPQAPPAERGRPTPAVGAPAAAQEVVPLSRMRQAIARRMSQSKREAPHYYVTIEVDMTAAMEFRASLNAAAADGVRVSVNDLIVKACAEMLRKYPPFNATLTEEGLRINPRINISLGIALPDGLIGPALLDVGGKSLGTIAREAHDLAERARSGSMRAAELNDGTFTISNLGMFGIETLIPIIQPPQSAILGVGAVEDKPAVRDGAVVIRKLMHLALAADHRVTDGAQGAEFLRDLKDLLEHPLRLAL
jgi:pyruvate dehydrogenase E2 component (dihydrolipoamide acetyltransferase)